ncbi:MAG TPA: NAD-binding protein [Candidatus Limiplasma sp.]|nr:NAD-binding protein [Candidatus Limiplasma sp.]
MYVIIAGCRKVGSSLAMELAQENHDVVVIDSDPDTGTSITVRLRAVKEGEGSDVQL